MSARPVEPTLIELFTPKLITVLREGYGFGDLHADVIAGLTVAIVALPLSMAIAIASGLSPDRGLYTAIVGGFVVSLLGGSRFQIGGPAVRWSPTAVSAPGTCQPMPAAGCGSRSAPAPRLSGRWCR